MGSSPKLRVVICGAGIGGLALAVALSKYPDIEVEVYEAANRLAEIGAGVGLFPRPWEIIRRLGLEEGLLRHCEMKPTQDPVKSFKYRKSDQREGLDFYELVTKGRLMAFHRADFQKVLLSKLSSSCRTHCSKRARSYKQHHAGPIEVFFEDGSTTTCDVLVGADGLKSAVRRSLLEEKAHLAKAQDRPAEAAEYKSSVEPKWSGQNAYRALIPAERLKAIAPNHTVFRKPIQYLGKDGYIIAYPINFGQMINFVAFTMQHEKEGSVYPGAWVSPTETSEFAKFFSDWEPEVRQLTNCVDKPLRWAIHTVKPLKSFVHGRVAVLGDAAHAMMPHQGSGAGQAIEDAYILSTVLGHRKTNRTNVHAALQVYDAVRRPLAQNVANWSRWNGRQFSFAGYDIDGLTVPELLQKLQALGDGVKHNWEWAWNTHVDASYQEALRRLDSALHP